LQHNTYIAFVSETPPPCLNDAHPRA
jgi:hypothetical protein